MNHTPRASISQQNSRPRPRHIANANDNVIILWRLRGAKHELVCTTIITSFGYALHLALAGEPILLELQRDVDRLTDKANRLEAWLLEQGWTRIKVD